MPRANPRVWVFGDHVSTDVITPGRMNVTTDETALARACFAEVRPELRDQAKPGDVVLGGANFGCGSSRESAPRSIKALGLTVVASSYGSIFYRNAVNVGLPVYIAPDAVNLLQDGDEVTIENGALHGPRGVVVPLQGAKGLLAEVVAAGGIVPYVRARGGRL